MALTIIDRSQTIPLWSPADPAIDLAAIDADPALLDRWRRYCRGEELLTEWIPLVEGQTPTVLTVRALTPRERDVAYGLTLGRRDLDAAARAAEGDEEPPEDDDEDPRDRIALASAAYLGWCVRLGLVSVSGLEGWEYRRASSYGVRAWSDRVLDALDNRTLAYLGMVVHRLSTVPFELAAPSGS